MDSVLKSKFVHRELGHSERLLVPVRFLYLPYSLDAAPKSIISRNQILCGTHLHHANAGLSSMSIVMEGRT